jgi:hypothetical protein
VATTKPIRSDFDDRFCHIGFWRVIAVDRDQAPGRMAVVSGGGIPLERHTVDDTRVARVCCQSSLIFESRLIRIKASPDRLRIVAMATPWG